MILTFVAKLRHMPKRPNEQMAIRNVSALEQMCIAILAERASPPDFAAAGSAKKEARQILDDEQKDYLAGQQLTIPMATGRDGYGFDNHGGLL